MTERYIAIVEDDENAVLLLRSYLAQYEQENKCRFNVVHFPSAKSFFEAGKCDFSILFMDIELPDGNGMQIVKKLREHDSSTLVIFVTNLAQYAVKGYEVRAFDFIVKPISYYNFSLKLSSALECLEENKEVEIWISNRDGRFRLLASEIYFVEVMRHYLTYHTANGDYTVLGSISAAANALKDAPFVFCNRCFLVNLNHVSQVRRTEVTVGGVSLQISRQKSAGFLKALNDWLAGGH